MIQYIVVSLITFLGMLLGVLVGSLAEEELKQGAKYLKYLQHTIFVLILLLFFYYNQSYVFLFLISGLIIVFSLFRRREIFYYYILSFPFFLSFSYGNGFAIIACLVFLYGFPLGSLYLLERLKDDRKEAVLSALKLYSPFLGLLLILGIIGLWL